MVGAAEEANAVDTGVTSLSADFEAQVQSAIASQSDSDVAVAEDQEQGEEEADSEGIPSLNVCAALVIKLTF